MKQPDEWTTGDVGVAVVVALAIVVAWFAFVIGSVYWPAVVPLGGAAILGAVVWGWWDDRRSARR